MIPENIKDEFPFFTSHPDMIYLDNSATTQKPQAVIDTLAKYYVEENANAGRSSYTLSSKLARRIEKVRDRVADFIGAEANEIAFTAGATDSFHKAILSLGFSYLKDGDEILYASDDHKSFVSPWFQLRDTLARHGTRITLTAYNRRQNGDAEIEDIYKKTTKQTKIIAITHLHNTYGADSDIHLLKDLREKGITIFVDATQSIGHMRVDVRELGADLLAFSGHKMFASPGSGVLFVDKNLQTKLTPLFVGGGEGSWVSPVSNKVEFVNFCHALESGTLNYPAILSLGPAISFIDSIGLNEIEMHLSTLTMQLIQGLSKIPGVIFPPGPKYWTCLGGYGVVAFSIEDIDSAEIGYALDQENILVRTGQFCRANEKDANLEGLIRVSAHVYNTEDDIKKFLSLIGHLVS